MEYNIQKQMYAYFLIRREILQTVNSLTGIKEYDYNMDIDYVLCYKDKERCMTKCKT